MIPSFLFFHSLSPDLISVSLQLVSLRPSCSVTSIHMRISLLVWVQGLLLYPASSFSYFGSSSVFLFISAELKNNYLSGNLNVTLLAGHQWCYSCTLGQYSEGTIATKNRTLTLQIGKISMHRYTSNITIQDAQI